MVTDKQKANLIPFKPGQSGNPKGRTPSFRSVFKKLPRDIQNKVAEILWTALAMSSTDQATEYLSKKADELPECGFMLQVCLKGLQGKDGAWVMQSILDRLLGKPRQQAEVKHTGNAGGVQVVVQAPETAAAVNALIGAAKKGPEKEA